MPPSPLRNRRPAYALLSVVALLAAGCGSGGAAQIPVAEPANLLPAADPGPDTVGRVGTQVVLDGSQSRDPEGGALTWRWVQTEGPVVTLSGLIDIRPTFTPTVAGTYVFDLVVEDVLGLGSTPSTVTVIVIDDLAVQPRRAPGAVARAAGLVHASFLVAPPAPLPSAVLLADGAARSVVVVDFVGDSTDDPAAAAVAGLVRVLLMVGMTPFAHLYLDTHPGDEDPVSLLVGGLAADEIVSFAVAGEPFVLDGSRSTDDGVVRTFTWTQVGGPFRFTTEDALVDAVVPVAGTYVFELRCTDDIGLSSFVQRLVIPVVPALPAVGPPDARGAFVGGTIPDGDPETPEVAVAGATVALTGAGSVSRNGGTLTFTWEQVAGPLAAMTGATTPNPSVVPPVAGAYAFELRVTDANGVADTEVLHLTVAPAGRPAPTPVLQPIPDYFLGAGGIVVVLDGATSTGDGSLTFLWQQTGGVPVFIDDAASGRGSIVPPQAGTYVFELRVADANGLSAPVRRSFRAR